MRGLNWAFASLAMAQLEVVDSVQTRLTPHALSSFAGTFSTASVVHFQRGCLHVSSCSYRACLKDCPFSFPRLPSLPDDADQTRATCLWPESSNPCPMPSRFKNLEIWQTAHREVVDKTNQTIAYSAWPVFVVSQLNGFADLCTE